MKKFSKVILAIMLVGLIIPFHQHDKDCGYDPLTEKGCIYEISLFQNNGPKG